MEFDEVEEIWLDEALETPLNPTIPEELPPLPQTRKKGNNWSFSETKIFIDLCLKENVERVIDQKHLKHYEIFQSLELELQKSGVNRDNDQLRVKYKKLKEAYRKAMRAGEYEMPFYKKLQQLFDYKIVEPKENGHNSTTDNIRNGDRVTDTRMVPRKKGTNWQNSETTLFLELCIKKNIRNLLSEKRYKHSQIFRSLEAHMRKHGVYRDSAQLRMKYKKLKEAYKKAIPENGDGQPYYTQMQRLFENYKSTGKDESPESITFTGNEVDISDFGINSTDITEAEEMTVPIQYNYVGSDVLDVSSSTVYTDQHCSDTMAIDDVEDNDIKNVNVPFQIRQQAKIKPTFTSTGEKCGRLPNSKIIQQMTDIYLDRSSKLLAEHTKNTTTALAKLIEQSHANTAKLMEEQRAWEMEQSEIQQEQFRQMMDLFNRQCYSP